MEDSENEDLTLNRAASKGKSPAKAKKMKKGKKGKKGKAASRNARETQQVESDNDGSEGIDQPAALQNNIEEIVDQQSEPNTAVQPTKAEVQILTDKEDNSVVQQQDATELPEAIVKNDSEHNENQSAQSSEKQVDDENVFITQPSQQHLIVQDEYQQNNDQQQLAKPIDTKQMEFSNQSASSDKNILDTVAAEIQQQQQIEFERTQALQKEIQEIQEKENERRRIEEENERQKQLLQKIEEERQQAEQEKQRQLELEKLEQERKLEEELRKAEEIKRQQQEKVSNAVKERLAQEQRQKQEQIDKLIEMRKQQELENQRKIEQYQKQQAEEKEKRRLEQEQRILQQRLKDEEKLRQQQKAKDDYEKAKEQQKEEQLRQQNLQKQQKQQLMQDNLDKKLKQLEEVIEAKEKGTNADNLNVMLTKQLLETNYRPELHRPPKPVQENANLISNGNYQEQINQIKLEGVDIDKLLGLKKETEMTSQFEQTLLGIKQKQKEYRVETVKNWETIDKNPNAQINRQVTFQQPLPSPEKKVHFKTLLMEEKKRYDNLKNIKQQYEEQMNPLLKDVDIRTQSPTKITKRAQIEPKPIPISNALLMGTETVSHQAKRSTKQSLLKTLSEKELQPKSHKNTIGSHRLSQIQSAYQKNVDSIYQQLQNIPSIYTVVRLDDLDDDANVDLSKFRTVQVESKPK